MGAPDIDLSRGHARTRALRAATLALIVERPAHGYELMIRLNQRLGPTWQVTTNQVYGILNDLEEGEIVVSIAEPSPGRPRQLRVVYHPTEYAGETLRRWLQSDLDTAPVRPDVLARIASAKQGDAQALLGALDDYETELLRMIEENDEPDLPVRSWSTLVRAIVRGHTDSYLHGEFQWVAVSRRRIREYVAGDDG